MLRRTIALLFCISTLVSTKPLEPYSDYLFILVHGIACNHKLDKEISIDCESAEECAVLKEKVIDTLRMQTGQTGTDFGVQIKRKINNVPPGDNDDGSSDTTWRICYTKTTYEEDGKASNLFDGGKDALDLDFGDLKGYLEDSLGMHGHVYSYNFDHPAETYYDTSASAMSLALRVFHIMDRPDAGED